MKQGLLTHRVLFRRASVPLKHALALYPDAVFEPVESLEGLFKDFQKSVYFKDPIEWESLIEALQGVANTLKRKVILHYDPKTRFVYRMEQCSGSGASSSDELIASFSAKLIPALSQKEAVSAFMDGLALPLRGIILSPSCARENIVDDVFQKILESTRVKFLKNPTSSKEVVDTFVTQLLSTVAKSAFQTRADQFFPNQYDFKMAIRGTLFAKVSAEAVTYFALPISSEHPSFELAGSHVRPFIAHEQFREQFQALVCELERERAYTEFQGFLKGQFKAGSRSRGKRSKSPASTLSADLGQIQGLSIHLKRFKTVLMEKVNAQVLAWKIDDRFSVLKSISDNLYPGNPLVLERDCIAGDLALRGAGHKFESSIDQITTFRRNVWVLQMMFILGLSGYSASFVLNCLFPDRA